MADRAREVKEAEERIREDMRRRLGNLIGEAYRLQVEIDLASERIESLRQQIETDERG